MRPPTNFLRQIILSSSVTNAGIRMRARARSARDVAPASVTRSRSQARSAHPRGIRTWACLTGTARCASRRGGTPATWCWWASVRARCSRRSTCSCCGGCSASECFAPPSVPTAMHTPRSISHLVSVFLLFLPRTSMAPLFQYLVLRGYASLAPLFQRDVGIGHVPAYDQQTRETIRLVFYARWFLIHCYVLFYRFLGSSLYTLH